MREKKNKATWSSWDIKPIVLLNWFPIKGDAKMLKTRRKKKKKPTEKG